MIRFLVRWLIVAALGSAAAWFGPPVLRERAPRVYGFAASAFARLPAPSAVVGRLRFARDRSEDQSAGSGSDADSGQVVSHGADTPGVSASGAAEPPAPPLPWGVVKAAAPFFDSSMHRLGTLPGGTPVVWTDRRDSTSGPVAECQPKLNGQWRSVSVIVLESDLALFDEEFEDADPARRDALVAYFAASAKLEKLRADAEARIEAARRNPHERDLAEAKSALDKVQAEANAVNEKVRWSNTHDLPGGSDERGRLLHRANEIRVEQAGARARFDEVSAKWKAWADDHPAPPSGTRPPDTPAMRALAEEMDRLRPLASKLVPGLR